MKSYSLNSIKAIGLLIFVFLFLIPINTEAQKKNRKKKNNIETVADKPKKEKKKKTIKELVKTSKEIDGLFKIYQDTITGSLKMIISEDQLDKDFIHFGQISNGITDGGRMNRGSYGQSQVFKINKYFNKIEFITQNTHFYFDPSNAISKSKDANTTNATLASIKIEAYDKDKGLYLIKADALFLKETFAQIKPTKRPGQSPMAFTFGNLSKDKSKIKSIKNYEHNTNLEVEYVYSKPSTINGGSNAVAGDGRNVSIKVFHSLIAMPNNDYKIRLDDPRVGYFLTQVDDQTSTTSTPYRDLIHRWNLVKKDPNAVLSEPVEPITWWMENSTPVEWRETIKEGVLRWNSAFEKAGFKNAMVVKMQSDTATWDAGDIRYNVLRWTSSPNPPFGGYGPSFVNPRTGEIMGADIMLEYVHFTNRVLYDKIMEPSATSSFNYSEFANKNHLYCSAGNLMHENTMFGQAVIALAGASDLEMVRMKKEAMLALIMHEVGHTLGLNHNMKASQLFSPEQLADASFIKGKCLTGSVMDYAGINLTNDRSKQGQYYDTNIGPYDVWAIQFGYTPFKSAKERADLLNQSTKPELIFGNDADDMRNPGKAIDPRVNTGDLSNDQIGYSIDRFELINKMLPEIKEKFTVEGESYQELTRVYRVLYGQKYVAAKVLSRFIGGVYVDRSMAGQKGETQPYTPVSLEDQKRAMDALSKYVFAPNAFDAGNPKKLFNYLANQRRGFNFFRGPEDPKIHASVLNAQKSVLAHLLHPNTLQRITDSELYGNEYSLSTFMTDLNKAIFNADINGNVNSFRQNLQIEYTNMLIAMLNGKRASNYTYGAQSMALYNLKTIKSKATNSGNIASRAHKQHLRTLIDNAIKEIK